MFKKTLGALGLLAVTSFSNAAVVVTDSVVTGDEMAGMSVQVNFDTSASMTGSWSAISSTPLTTGNAIIDLNGFVGGWVTPNFSFTQSGSTLGGITGPTDTPANTPYGMWTLTNTGTETITGFSIFGQAAGVAFDIVPVTTGTPGSDGGQEFVSDIASKHAYSNQVDAAFSDLYYTLTVGFTLDAGESINFFADTDKVSQVSAPASMAFVLASLVLFSRRLSRTSK